MKIALLGGAGYVGSVVNSELSVKHRVTVYDNLIYSDEYTPSNLVRVDVLNEEIDLSGFDRIVWMLDIDVPSFYTFPISQQYCSKNISVFKNMCEKYGDRMMFITDLYDNGKILSYKKFIEDKLAICNHRILSIALPQLYGPSPRMRFDTDLNSMFFIAYLSGGITLDNWLDRVKTASIATAGRYIAENIVDTAPLSHGIQSYNHSVIEYAGIMVKVFEGKLEMVLSDSYGDTYENPIKENVTMEDVRWLPVDDGATIKKSFEYILNGLSKGLIDGPTKDRYNNAKIINSYQYVARFTDWINNGFKEQNI